MRAGTVRPLSCAYQAKRSKRDALEVGELADLAVLDKDYMQVPIDEIGTIGSVLTMVDGKITYAAGPYGSLAP